MIRIKICQILSSSQTRENPRENGKKRITKKIITITSKDRKKFSKKLYLKEEGEGFRRIITRGPIRCCLLPVASSVPFLPWPWVHDSRVTRELSHVTRSLPPVPPRAPIADQHQRALAARVRTREIVLRWCRTVPCSGVARLQRCPLPPWNSLASSPNKLPLSRASPPFSFSFSFSFVNLELTNRRPLGVLRAPRDPSAFEHARVHAIALSLSSFTPFSIPLPPPSLPPLYCFSVV